jgi:hypothetical protein
MLILRCFFIFLGHVPSSAVFDFFFLKQENAGTTCHWERACEFRPSRSFVFTHPAADETQLLLPGCWKDKRLPLPYLYLYIYIRTWLYNYIWQYIIFNNPPFQSLSIGSIHLGSSGVRNWKRKTRMLRSNLPQAPSGHAAEKESDWWLVRSNKMSEA